MKTLRRRGGTLAFCYYINRTFERAMDFQYKDSISAELHNNRKGTESMAKKKVSIPQYGTVMRRGIQYYRTRITDADGKRVDLYAETSEELYEKELEARRQVEEAVFRRKHPTVAEYCEKWLLMQSAKVSSSTLKGYTQNMNNYIVKPLGDMYLSEVTADDIRLALIPLSQKSAGLYSTVNMLLKCVFYSAERNQLLDYNPCVGISAKGGKPGKKKNALTDEQVKLLLETVRELPPYVFIMIGLYSGLRREEILALQWDCVFLDVPTPYISVRRAWRTEHNRPVISTTLKTKAAQRDIRVWCGWQDGCPAVLVENMGAHIGEDALPHLYEAFYREECSRNRTSGGSGLGLYLVKMILDRHGAMCSIKNTECGVQALVRFAPRVVSGLTTEDVMG